MIILFILSVLIVSGCDNIDVSKLSDEDLQRISDKAIVCNTPYIRYGSSCCLDTDNNQICDMDERELTAEEKQAEEEMPIEEELGEVSEDIENDMIDRIRESDDRLALRENDIEIKKSSEKKIYFGVRNEEEDETSFDIEFLCDSAMDEDANLGDITFNVFKGTKVLEKDEIIVLPAVIKISPNAVATTYMCSALINDGEYASKTFYITVVKEDVPEEPEEEMPIEEELGEVSENIENDMINRIIDFEPGLKKTFYFEVPASRLDVNVSIYGYLSEYATISKKLIKSGDTDRTFTVTVKLPEKEDGLNPGHHKIWVSEKEILGTAESGGNVGTSSNVIVYILINIPNKGKYVDVTLSAPNVNLNEPVNFAVNVKSFGKEDINSIKAAIDVYSPDNEKLATIYTDEKSLKSNTEETLHAQLSTVGYKAGIYGAVATLNYDGETKEDKKSLRIGELNIRIINYTKEFEKDKINKFDIEIESKWGNNIKYVYGEIKINNYIIKTPNIGLAPWEKKTITTYWNTDNFEIGFYDTEMTIYYEGKTTIEIGKVSVVEKKSIS